VDLFKDLTNSTRVLCENSIKNLSCRLRQLELQVTLQIHERTSISIAAMIHKHVRTRTC